MNTYWVCDECKKRPQVVYNRPHSLKRTKRWVKPNIQKTGGRSLCTSCKKTLVKQGSLPVR